jgi:hypothetical protein
MELIVEFLLELLLEVLFAAVVGLFDSGLTTSTRAPGLRAFALAIAGVGLGFASTFVFPNHFIQARTLQLVWLLVAPLLGGTLIAGFRAVLRAGEPDAWRWAKFAMGALFVGCLNATRFSMLG